MENVSVLQALIGVALVIGVGAWMWKKKNSDKARDAVRDAQEFAKEAGKDVAAKAKAKAKK